MSGTISECCLKGFRWEGTPQGRTAKLANNDAYITGSNPDAAILFVPDFLGWTFPNARILADHLAEEARATVYVVDFFGGFVVDFDLVLTGQWDKVDLPTFQRENSREVREPEVMACARALRAQYKKVGAIGFCYGGWACLRLGAREHNPPLVDAIVVGHPSWVTKQDIDELATPVQVLAPEHDRLYTAELKKHSFETFLKNNIPFDYRHFPGVEHGCLTRGDHTVPGEREAMAVGKDAAASWFSQYVH